MSAKDLVTSHITALLAEAEAKQIPTDVIGRTLLDQVIWLWSKTRSPDDIRSELEFIAGNVGEDDFTFMRP